MNKLFLFSLLALSFSLLSCDKDDDKTQANIEEVVVVANRSSGSISFINAETDEVIETLTISGSEPMYVVFVSAKDRIYVGDRAQKQVHVINPDSRELETSIPVGEGVFHMWADGQGKQLWVNNDIDNTISVINLTNHTVTNTINIGVKPHDVFLTNSGTKAYVTVLIGDENVRDSVYAFSTSSFEKLASKAVGDDPHLYHLPSNNRLYVPNQSGTLFVLDENDLSTIDSVSMAGSHGIYPSPDNKYLFITNLPGSQIFSFQTADNTIKGSALGSDISVPHNITLNKAGSKAFITHSGGSANQVTVYNISDGTPTLSKTLTVQNNPFGIAYYQR
ncbi:YncE family protein [Membranihabitans marinus]|uniref:YncE family protein n=1 Tax=Membranihabitans marinus TaxID=1227546 RepID=UPI001F1BCA4E|nr:YncE family protein [Membranihabitans marinus]